MGASELAGQTPKLLLLSCNDDLPYSGKVVNILSMGVRLNV
jgi:hypothetical protein